MTPAEALAFTVLLSFAYGALEGIVDRNAVTLTVNNKLAGLIRILFALTALVLALVVVL